MLELGVGYLAAIILDMFWHHCRKENKRRFPWVHWLVLVVLLRYFMFEAESIQQHVLGAVLIGASLRANSFGLRPREVVWGAVTGVAVSYVMVFSHKIIPPVTIPYVPIIGFLQSR